MVRRDTCILRRDSCNRPSVFLVRDGGGVSPESEARSVNSVSPDDEAGVGWRKSSEMWQLAESPFCTHSMCFGAAHLGVTQGPFVSAGASSGTMGFEQRRPQALGGGTLRGQFCLRVAK